MPLVPETKIADVGKLISLGNLLARKTTCIVLTTTSATPLSFPSSLTGSTHSFQCDLQREHSNSLHFNTHFLLFTFDFHQSTTRKMSTPYNHSLPYYTFSVRLFPAPNTEISSNHRKKQTVEILSQHALDTCYLVFILQYQCQSHTHTHTHRQRERESIFNEQYQKTNVLICFFACIVEI